MVVGKTLGLRAAGCLAALLFGGLSTGCASEEEDEFTYGKAEMESQIVGTWTGSLLPADAAPSELTLVLDTKNDPSSRSTACSHQTFSAASPPGARLACSASSSLALTGTLSVGNESLETTDVDGEFVIDSLNVGPGMLFVYSPDGSIYLTATQDQDYTFTQCTVEMDAGLVGCTLDARL